MNAERQIAIREPLQKLMVQIAPHNRPPRWGKPITLPMPATRAKTAMPGNPISRIPLAWPSSWLLNWALQAMAEMMAAALLHDAVRRFCPRTQRHRTHLWQNHCHPGQRRDKSAKSRASRTAQRIATLQHLFTYARQDPRVLILKLADRMYNIRSLDGIAEQSRRKRIARETVDIYAPLSHLLGMARIRRELEDRSLCCLKPQIANQIQAEFEPNCPSTSSNFETPFATCS